jgi:hypothetical protein
VKEIGMTETDDTKIPGELWKIGCKLTGIGELIKFSNGEAALNQDEANLGVGEILTDLAEELRDIRDELEGRQYRPTREMPHNFKGDEEDDDASKS